MLIDPLLRIISYRYNSNSKYISNVIKLSIRMDFFGVLRQLLTIFGLQPFRLTRRQNFAAVFTFLIIYIPNFIFLILGLYNTDDPKERMNFIQMLPSLVIALGQTINFVTKSKNADRLFSQINALYDEPDARQFLEESYQSSKRIICFTGTMSAFTLIAGIIYLLVSKELIMLIRNPFDCVSLIYIFLVLQTIFFIYSSTLSFILDSTIIQVVILLQAYSEYLRMRYQNVEGTKASIIEIIGFSINFKR